MGVAQSKLIERPKARPRLVGRCVVIAFLTAAYAFLMQSSAFASGGLSSVILPNSEPGLVAAPPGDYNGPITQSNVGAVLGNSTGAGSALGQSLASGNVAGYIRTWGHQPANGDAVVIVAFEFTNASVESSFVNGLASGNQNQSGSTPVAVPGIPGASGSVTHPSTLGTAGSEYVVTFAKGNTAFDVDVASSSGDLTSADAITLANQQFASAPDIPASGAGTNWHWWRVSPLVGIPLFVAIILIGRMRKYPTALRGLASAVGDNRGPAAVGSPGPWGPPPPPAAPIPTDQRPKVSAHQWQ